MNEEMKISDRASPAQDAEFGAAGAGPAPHFAVQASYVRTVFFGSDGLRAGWGLAFYVGMFYPLQFMASRWAWSLKFGGAWLWSMALAEFGVLVAAIVPSLVLARVEKRAWGVYGLPGGKAFGKLFGEGAMWGFASITVLLTMMYGLRVFAPGHLALHGRRIAEFALFWGAFFLVVGFFEEFLLRGYLQFTLTRVIGFWPAAVLLSCAFGLIHLQNAGEQWTGLVAAATIGFFFCLTLRRTGNLWFAVGFHMAWDWGETFVYSVPDSGTIFPGHLLKSSFHGPRWITGGRVGPEGSLLCFLVMAMVWVAFGRAYAAGEKSQNL